MRVFSDCDRAEEDCSVSPSLPYPRAPSTCVWLPDAGDTEVMAPKHLGEGFQIPVRFTSPQARSPWGVFLASGLQSATGNLLPQLTCVLNPDAVI